MNTFLFYLIFYLIILLYTPKRNPIHDIIISSTAYMNRPLDMITGFGNNTYAIRIEINV